MLESIESQFKAIISQGEAPFLSLLNDHILPSQWEHVQNFFGTRKSFFLLKTFFSTFPATTTCYLTYCISKNLTDQFRIWPSVEQGFGFMELNVRQKEEIWESFRASLRQLDLPILSKASGSHYMVNEFLHHTGVPIGQAGKLAEKMALFGERNGFPDSDDPDSLLLWQRNLLDILIPPFPKTARKGIELDTQAYYSKIFVQLIENELHANDDNLFQIKMREALQSGAVSKHRESRYAPPRIVLFDEFPCLMLPYNANSNWSVSIDGSFLQHDSLANGGIIPLEEIPHNISVTTSAHGKNWALPVWGSKKNNEMLLFGDRDKRLLPDRPTFENAESMFIQPGKYALLSRFAPDSGAGEPERIASEPDIYLTYFALGPSEIFAIRSGPAEITIQAVDEPLISIQNDAALVDANGTAMYRTGDLKISVKFPERFYGKCVDIHAKTRCLGGNVTWGNLRADISFEVALSEKLQHWSPGLSLVKLSCCLTGTTRELASISILLWHGLLKPNLKHGNIECIAIPSNLIHGLMYNCDISGTKLNIANKYAKEWIIKFDDGGRIHELRFARPGISLRLRQIINDEIVETPLQLGYELPVGEGTSKQLYISGLGDGVLAIGNATFQTNINKSLIRLPIVNIFDEMTPYDNKLKYISNLDSEERILLSIVHPWSVIDSSVKIISSQEFQQFSFELYQQPEELCLYIKNIITSEITSHTIPIESCVEEKRYEILPDMKIFCSYQKSKITLNIDSDNCPDGIWLITVELAKKNHRGRLSNERQDFYAWSFAKNDGVFHAPDDALSLMTKACSDLQHVCIIEYLQCLLCTCFAESVWRGHLEWIKKSWFTCIDKILCEKLDNSAYIKGVQKLFDCVPPADSHPSWLPLTGLTTHFPSLLAMTSSWYANDIWGNSPIIRSLCNASQARESCHLAFLVAVANGFKIAGYLEALRSTVEDCPSIQNEVSESFGGNDNLGHKHLSRAILRFYYTLQQVEAGTSNPYRKDWATLIAERPGAYNELLKLKIGTVDQWNALFFLAFQGDLPSKESFVGKVTIIATYALFCRQQAWGNGCVDEKRDNYLKSLKSDSITMEHVRIGHDYLVLAGDHLLEFFLLFWEVLLQNRAIS